MAEEKAQALDLDELFGQTRAIKVKWQGKQYELIRLEALGPRQIASFQAMRRKAGELQAVSAVAMKADDPLPISDEQADDIEKLFGQMLKMLCAEFPVDIMPFQMKVRTLEFYIEETAGKKVVENALKKVTGRRRSPA